MKIKNSSHINNTCSNADVLLQVTYIRNRIKNILSSIEFEELEASEAEYNNMNELYIESADLQSHLERVTKHTKASLSEDDLSLFDSLIEIVNKYEEE